MPGDDFRYAVMILVARLAFKELSNFAEDIKFVTYHYSKNNTTILSRKEIDHVASLVSESQSIISTELQILGL